jgi:hypothetical protein
MSGEAVTDWTSYFDDMGTRQLSERIARLDKERLEKPVSASRWLLDDFVGTCKHEGLVRRMLGLEATICGFELMDCRALTVP